MLAFGVCGSSIGVEDARRAFWTPWRKKTITAGAEK